ncbi:MAG: tetratricopeptide repeat protein [Planctomycetota bacterium]|nr:MAG: tetratricopeptide repeat protein [Planctomycetota bacterium]
MSQDVMDTVIGASQPSAAELEASRSAFTEGQNLEAAGDRAGAIAAYRRAVAANPDSSDAVFRLAYLLDLTGEDDEALALYERLAATPPAPVNALVNLAVIYEDRGQYAAAERALRQVLDTDPNHPRARLFMKDVLASRDMYYDEAQDRDLLRRNALLDTPVTDFELSVRARNCLKKMNIRTLGDLLRVSESELLAYKNFGEASLQEIRDMLTAKGLRLGQSADEAHRHIRREIYDRARRTGADKSLEKPISDLNLSVRARKALQALGVRTVGELAARTEAELMGVKNFGQTSLDEVKEQLGALGLTLRTLDFDENVTASDGPPPADGA